MDGLKCTHYSKLQHAVTSLYTLLGVWWVTMYKLYTWMGECNTTTIKQLLLDVNISNAILYLVDVYLEFIHSDVSPAMIGAHSHFNVIPHFLVQCGSEPRATAITASAIRCTTLWVPQRVIKVPLGCTYMYMYHCSLIRSNTPLPQMEVQHIHGRVRRDSYRSWRCILTALLQRSRCGFEGYPWSLKGHQHKHLPESARYDHFHGMLLGHGTGNHVLFHRLWCRVPYALGR